MSIDATMAMWHADQASNGLGMTIEHLAPGTARLAMRVQPHMLNGHRTCHGGYIFTLADSAFALACNTGNLVSVAAHCTISFLHPARENDLLVATAEQRHREGRSGLYDVRVTCNDATIAEFRGHSRTTGQTITPEDHR